MRHTWILLLFCLGCPKPLPSPVVVSLSPIVDPVPAKGTFVSVEEVGNHNADVLKCAAVRAIYFEFDDSHLTATGAELLSHNESCIRGHVTRLVGHADVRGTEEYNFALGTARAESVAQYLKMLGISKPEVVSRGKLDSTGADEVGWREDRRVDLQ